MHPYHDVTRKSFPSTVALSLVALSAVFALLTSACPEVGKAGVPGSLPMQRPPVAAVRIDPGELSLPAGAIDVAQATVLDNESNPVTNRPVLWTTDNPEVARVDQAGIITGVAPGDAVISALCGGIIGTARVRVTESVERLWPNEPVSFATIEDQSWSVVDAVKWTLQWGTATIVPDLAAPFSGPLSLQITYPTGFEGGTAPGTMELEFPRRRAIYTGLWWKVSDPWQGHPSNVNKIQFLFSANGSPTYMGMYGSPGGPYDLRILPSFTGLPSDWFKPNVKDVPVTLGVWHRIEWLVVYNTTTDPPNGVYRWWLDGELVGDHTNVEFPTAGLQYFKVSPTWGGIGAFKTETDYYRYDHIHISGR